jgi:hypothetical protein
VNPRRRTKTAAETLTSLPDEHRTGMVLKYAADFHRVAGRTDIPARTEFAELLRA